MYEIIVCITNEPYVPKLFVDFINWFKNYDLVTSLNYNILASGNGLLPIRQIIILTNIDLSTHPQLETDDENTNEIRKFPFSRIFQWKGQQGLTVLRRGCNYVFSKSNSAPLHKDFSASSACINVGIVNVYIHIIDHGYKKHRRRQTYEPTHIFIVPGWH